eukprot:scaffold12312_cov63-Phaeocystis_antarctica.AAC.12
MRALSANARCMKVAARSCSSSVSASPAAARAAACCEARSTANEPSPSPSVFSSFSGGTMLFAIATRKTSSCGLHRAGLEGKAEEEEEEEVEAFN